MRSRSHEECPYPVGETAKCTFVTGATGYVGSMIVDDLLAAGHRVTGLVRDVRGAAMLGRKDVEPHWGELTDPDGVAAGAAKCDGVVHTAFINDFSRHDEVAEIDRKVVTALAATLAGSDRPLVATSVVTLLARGRIGTEEDRGCDPAIPRAASEDTVLAAGSNGVRASVVRLPFSVHGGGDSGFIPALIDLARRKRQAAYVDDGQNRWCAVGRADAARLFRLALEGVTPGTALHAVAEGAIPMKAIAEAIGAGLGVPIVSVPADRAGDHFEWLARFVSVDQPISRDLTRRWLEWKPNGRGLLPDLEANGYFDENAASKYSP